MEILRETFLREEVIFVWSNFVWVVSEGVGISLKCRSFCERVKVVWAKYP